MKTVTNSELLGIVADKSDYLKYEVQDILNILAVTIAEELKKGNKVQLSGIGTFGTKIIQPRTFVSAIDGVEYTTTGSTSASLKIDGYLKNALNKESTNVQ